MGGRTIDPFETSGRLQLTLRLPSMPQTWLRTCAGNLPCTVHLRGAHEVPPEEVEQQHARDLNSAMPN
eukprot:8515688-Pyramimonas_sp.AAC.1